MNGVPAGPSVSDSNYFYYTHGDHLGSTHILTEGNKTGGKHNGIFYNQGTLIQRIEYNPFGQEKYVLNPGLQFDPSYTGQKYDIESGLYFYKSRYYNPLLGRFIQPDTQVPSATDYQSYNRYSYVRNNPLKYTDPSGHSFWSVFKKIAGAVLGAAVAVIVAAAIIAMPGIGALGAFGVALVVGTVAGAAGGLVGGAITGGLQGAMYGMLMGMASGLVSGGATYVFGKAIMLGLAMGLSFKQDGWQGIMTFGASLLGAAGGSKIAGGFGSAGGMAAGRSGAAGPAGRAGAMGYANGGMSATPIGAQLGPEIAIMSGFAASANLATASTFANNTLYESLRNAIRSPDYVSLNVNVGSFVGWSGQAALDRNGNLYIGIIGANAGKSTSVVSGSATGGWVTSLTKPTPDQLTTLLSANGFNAGAGYIGGAGATTAGGIVAAEVGAFYPAQAGGSWHYSFQVHQFDVSW